MVTTNSPSPSPEPQQVAEPRTTEVAASPNFFGQLIGSIFEVRHLPGTDNVSRD